MSDPNHITIERANLADTPERLRACQQDVCWRSNSHHLIAWPYG
jgi:hypothetical protein